MNVEIVAGIEYQKPKIYLLQETGIGAAEFAGRTAYDSFDKSEHESVKLANTSANDGSLNNYEKFELNHIESSKLLESLAWVHHHHSVLELANLTFLVKGTSRGVLQEHARHRLQSLTVQSTRYTMSPIINAFNACDTFKKFKEIVSNIGFLVVGGFAKDIEIKQLYEKLEAQFTEIGDYEFLNISCSKEQKEILMDGDSHSHRNIFSKLQKAKQKRNVGDSFKWIVTDNWKVDLVFNMNLRNLKNYLELRDSGAAYFQMRWLAQAVKEATPIKYLKLIDKSYKEK